MAITLVIKTRSDRMKHFQKSATLIDKITSCNFLQQAIEKESFAKL
jgi:hypothetical protein